MPNDEPGPSISHEQVFLAGIVAFLIAYVAGLLRGHSMTWIVLSSTGVFIVAVVAGVIVLEVARAAGSSVDAHERALGDDPAAQTTQTLRVARRDGGEASSLAAD